MPHFLLNVIDNALGNTLLLSIVIVICAFLLEDLTTIVVGVLAADGYISISLALISIYIGIAIGDTFLYSLGALARSHPRLARYIDHDYTSTFRVWLTRRYRLVIFSGHFVPGLRFTTYVASGFFRRPLSEYIPSAIAGGVLLATGWFTLSFLFGSLTTAWMKPVRWGIAILFIIALVYIARKNLRAVKELHALQETPSSSDAA